MESSFLDSSVLDNSVLDNPAWTALTGPHERFAERNGQAVRYRPDITPFGGLPAGAEADPQTWTDIAELLGPGESMGLIGVTAEAPVGWAVTMRLAGVQLVDVALDAAEDPEAVALTAVDVPEMLDLIDRTKPGPFLPRTVELGGYLGIRRSGRLVAMAGERLHPPGWTEISAVCTDAAHRGQGLAARLTRAVAANIRARGDTPFLHTAEANTAALRLYRSLGFAVRRRVQFSVVRAPG